MATGDLRKKNNDSYDIKTHLLVPPPTLGMLLVCCLVKARDRVL